MGAENHRGIVVAVITVAFFVDGLLITALIPILPNLLRDQRERDSKADLTPPGIIIGHAVTHVPGVDVNRSVATNGFSAPLDNGTRTTSNPFSSDDNDLESGENTRNGLLLASKMAAQLLTNAVVGTVTTRVGYTIPIFAGMVILLASTIPYIIFDQYVVLLVCRIFQGIGAAFSSTAGAGLVAKIFPDQKQRSFAQNMVHSGLAVGVMVGPPFGGTLYDVTGGKMIPYIILSSVIFIEIVMMLIFNTPKYRPETKEGSSFFKLLADPHMTLVAVVIAVAALGLAFVEPVLPNWMYHTMDASVMEQGIVILPGAFAEFMAMQLFGIYAHRFKRFHPRHSWCYALFGVCCIVGGAIGVPESKTFVTVIFPLIVLGFGFGLVAGSMSPYMGYVVDVRHGPVYAAAYAIVEIAFNLAFALGPAISGPLVDEFGFTWAIRFGAIGCSLAAVCALFLIRSPKRKNVFEVNKEVPTPIEMQPSIATISS